MATHPQIKPHNNPIPVPIQRTISHPFFPPQFPQSPIDVKGNHHSKNIQKIYILAHRRSAEGESVGKPLVYQPVRHAWWKLNGRMQKSLIIINSKGTDHQQQKSQSLMYDGNGDEKWHRLSIFFRETTNQQFPCLRWWWEVISRVTKRDFHIRIT